MRYTSGATARPKDVVVTHSNCVFAGEVYAAAMRLSSRDTVLVTLPLFHVNAQYYSVTGALVSGARIVIAPRFRASAWMEQVVGHRATVTNLFAAPIRTTLATAAPEPASAVRTGPSRAGARRHGARRRVAGRCRNRLGHRRAAGPSRTGPLAADPGREHRDRFAGLSATDRSVVSADDLGLMRFLIAVENPSPMREFVVEQLGPLHGDARRGGDLLATLRVFLESGGRHADVARCRHIHPSTVKYRLARIARLLGRDLGDPDVRFELRPAYALDDTLRALGVSEPLNGLHEPHSGLA